MTTKNYTHLTSKELLDEIENLNIYSGRLSIYLKNHCPELLQEIERRTNFIQDMGFKVIPITERLYCIEHNLTEHPRCSNPNCRNFVKWSHTGKNAYQQYCCSKCKYEDKKFFQKIKQSILDKYGVESTFQLESVKDKSRKTNLERRGVEYASQSPEFRKRVKTTCQERYGVDNPLKSKTIQEKIKQTCLDKYGTENVFQAQVVKQKIIQTNIERYGGVNPMCSKLIQDKVKQTNFERRGVEYTFQSNEVKDKIKQTCIEKYGVEHYSQTQEFKDKRTKTCMERYGCDSYSKTGEFKDSVSETWENKTQDELNDIVQKRIKTNIDNRGVEFPTQAQEVKDKVKCTFLDHYGVEHYSQTQEFKDRFKQTSIEKYGVDYPIQSKHIQNKIKSTMLQKYGVEWYTQSEQYHKTKKHKFESMKYPGNFFDSTWEVKVFEFCKDNRMEVEYSPGVSLSYEYDGEIFTYHPDFLINGKLYEVKGEQFFRFNETTGQDEMMCPYRDPLWTNEQYAWVCGKYEAKHQCMLRNNVTILRKYDIDKLSNGLELSI